jgi:hypothetical protein
LDYCLIVLIERCSLTILTPIILKEDYFIFNLRNFFLELLFLMKIILILSSNIFRAEFVDFLEKYNGHSPANLSNLSNSSTRRKFAIFGECEYSPKRSFLETCETRQTRICQKLHFMILAKLEFAKNYILWYSPNSPAFGECTMLSIERERLYFMYIERERLKGTSWNLFKFSLSPSHTHKTG